MSERKITQNSGNIMPVSIPAYLGEKYGLERGTFVDATENGTSIVITSIKEQ
jgi:bifunctional DNA-binding transcriptional regulator/antitoxin component of YhaV-PrlF toxin-antitoxin module